MMAMFTRKKNPETKLAKYSEFNDNNDNDDSDVKIYLFQIENFQIVTIII